MKTISRRELLRNSALAAGAAVATAGTVRLGGIARAADAQETGTRIAFPTAKRERLAVATWPFREFIVSAENEYRDKTKPGMDLREFAVTIPKVFGVPGVEPLSSHFSSTDERYVHGFREALEKAGMRAVNIPVDNSTSYYDADPAARAQTVANGKKWVDIAVILGAPSVRTSIAGAKNAKPNVETAAGEIRKVVEYAASKNILVDLENDNLISEDAFFLEKVIGKVNHPNLKALPDFCNSMASGDEKFNYDAVTMLFRHAYNICHVKDSEGGDGGKVFRVDLKRTFGILNASHYKGYLSMEWEGGGDPYEGTKKLIAASLENLS